MTKRGRCGVNFSKLCNRQELLNLLRLFHHFTDDEDDDEDDDDDDEDDEEDDEDGGRDEKRKCTLDALTMVSLFRKRQL